MALQAEKGTTGTWNQRAVAAAREPQVGAGTPGSPRLGRAAPRLSLCSESPLESQGLCATQMP